MLFAPVVCRKLLLLVCVLIGYGSLYPFSFEHPGPDEWKTFLSEWGGHDSTGDLLGNIALFVPYGLLGTLAFPPRADARGQLITVVLSGGVLAIGLQAVQLFTPTRDPALFDVAWNSLGIVLGVLAAIPLARWTAGYGDRHGSLPMSAVLTGFWALSQLVPFVPSLDLQAFMGSLKPLFNVTRFSMTDTGIAAAGVLAAATLLTSSTRPRRILLLLPLALLAIACAKILVITQHLDWETLIGWTLGYGAFLCIQPLQDRTRFGICVLTLLFAYTLTALEPFALRNHAGTFYLVPFADLLEGSMLSNETAVVPRLALFAMVLWLLRLMAGTVWPGSILLAFWIGLLELIQIILEGRTASITDSLLVLLISWILSQFRDVTSGSFAAPGQRRYPTPEVNSPAPAQVGSEPACPPPATTSGHPAGPSPPIPIRSTVLLTIWRQRDTDRHQDREQSLRGRVNRTLGITGGCGDVRHATKQCHPREHQRHFRIGQSLLVRDESLHLGRNRAGPVPRHGRTGTGLVPGAPSTVQRPVRAIADCHRYLVCRRAPAWSTRQARSIRDRDLLGVANPLAVQGNRVRLVIHGQPERTARVHPARRT
jgi:VanZ family protein